MRFLPLPPAFNARPYTLYQWLQPFGVAVYHGKEMWQHKNLAGKPASVRELVRERLVRRAVKR